MTTGRINQVGTQCSYRKYLYLLMICNHLFPMLQNNSQSILTSYHNTQSNCVKQYNGAQYIILFRITIYQQFTLIEHFKTYPRELHWFLSSRPVYGYVCQPSLSEPFHSSIPVDTWSQKEAFYSYLLLLGISRQQNTRLVTSKRFRP